MAMLAAGYVMTATGLYLPGEKLISIPSHKYFVREGALGWFKDGVAFVRAQEHGIIEVPAYFDVDIRGAELAHAIREE